MSYSRKLVTLDRMEPILTPACTGEIVEWQTDNPAALAYKIREAFFLTTLYPTRYPHITALARSARLKVFRHAAVVLLFPNAEAAATYDRPNSRILNSVRSRASIHPPMPAVTKTLDRGVVEVEEPLEIESTIKTYVGEPEAKSVTVSTPHTRFDIIGTWDKLQESPDLMKKISFLDAKLSNSDLNKLSRWAASHNWLVIPSDQILTLLPNDNDPITRSLAWIPTDE